MSSIVSLRSGREYSVERTLKILDDLRASIASGEFIAFAAVGLKPDDTTATWVGAARVVSPTLLIGAMAAMQYWYIDSQRDGDE